MEQKTATQWLIEQLTAIGQLEVPQGSNAVTAIIEQAKAMEKEQSHLYAEFAIRCDRNDMKILNFEDWMKL